MDLTIEYNGDVRSKADKMTDVCNPLVNGSNGSWWSWRQVLIHPF